MPDLAPPSDPTPVESLARDPRWARATLDGALWHAAAPGLGLWQLGVGILMIWRTPDERATLLLLHGAFAVIGLVAARVPGSPLFRATFFASVYLILGFDLVAAGDDLSMTVVSMTLVITATPFLVMAPWSAAIVSWGSTAVVMAWALRDGIDAQHAVGVAVTTGYYSLGALAIIRALRRYADEVDENAVTAAEEHARTVAARASARTAAEYSRTLHDTVVNTLAAIASGASSTAEPEKVRLRCAQDVALIRALLAGEHASPAGLDGVASDTTVTLTWTGLDDEARHELESQVPAVRRQALRSMVRELVLNVEEHSGTDRAEIDVRADEGRLVVTVTDHGVGFEIGPTARRGLTHSVFGRADESDIDVDLATAPGMGTRVRLICPFGPDPDDGDDADAEGAGQAARGLRFTAACAWAGAICTAAIVTTAVRGADTWSGASTALVAALSLACWVRCRRGAALPTWLGFVAAAGVPVAFALAFLGATRDPSSPALWQGLGLTPILVILLNTPRSRAPVVAAAGLLAATAGGAAALAWSTEPLAAQVGIANGLTQLSQTAVWVLFLRLFDDITQRAAGERRSAFRDRSDRASLEAALFTQDRWRDAGLLVVVDLLDAVAKGNQSAIEPAVVRQAGAEEHYLRQVLLLDPGLIHLGPWLSRALGQSRANAVRLTIRVGDRDLEDPTTANRIGGSLLDLLESVPEGAELTVSYFGHHAPDCVTVVGAAGFSDGAPLGPSGIDGHGCSIERTTILEQDVVEIRPAARTAA